MLFSAWEQRHSAVSLIEEFNAVVEQGMAKRAESEAKNGKSEDDKVERGEAEEPVTETIETVKNGMNNKVDVLNTQSKFHRC